MPDCELLSTCDFFNDLMPDFPATSEFLKNKYCKGIYCECARYRVCKVYGRENVPKGLFPQEIARLNN